MKTRAVFVNDTHSQSNRTRLRELHAPTTTAQVAAIIRHSAKLALGISIAGGRHAMGGQQFGRDTVGLDLRSLSRVLEFDRERGLIEAEAGICWPELIRTYLTQQGDGGPQWSIRQKQTGADELTLGGSLAANIHGRSLGMAPLMADVESFTLIDALGDPVSCSRTQNPLLFSAAIGGYGLFGPIVTVTLRLCPRRKIERVVELRHVSEVAALFSQRTEAGWLYGDFQFCIDETSDGFLTEGVASFYRPVCARTPMNSAPALSGEAWLALLGLAFTDRREGFRRYVEHYLSTDGQIYWSDLHQLGPYVSGYGKKVAEIARRAGLSPHLMITELAIPPGRLEDFMREAAGVLRRSGTPVIYGTVRVTEADTESFLPWAREKFCTVIFNLPLVLSGPGHERAAAVFRALIDLALSMRGSFYLTYHRFASSAQVRAAYPRFDEFLALKDGFDPEHRFRSSWWEHYRAAADFRSAEISGQTSNFGLTACLC